MNSFRELVMELCASFEMNEPVLAERSASIALGDITLTIKETDSALNFSALIGALPMTSPQREEATRKLLQGSLSILRSHSILIHVVNKQGQQFVAADYNIAKNEINSQNIKSDFQDFRAITAALTDIITGPKPDNFHYHTSVNPADETDEIEFVFRA